MTRLLLLFAITLLSSACVSIPNVKECTAKGRLRFGALCGESNTGVKSKMTAEEYVEFLEPEDERDDPEHPGQKLPKRAGAVCISAEDHNKRKTALEQACRLLGSRCSFELKQAIQGMKADYASSP